MKLKKFAALALAGVMAVSMLAGCAGKGTEEPTEEPTTGVTAEAVIKALNEKTSEKITFTASTSLESTLEKAVQYVGVENIENNVNNLGRDDLINFDSTLPDYAVLYANKTGELKDTSAEKEKIYTDAKTNTITRVTAVTSDAYANYTEDAIVKVLAKAVDDLGIAVEGNSDGNRATASGLVTYNSTDFKAADGSQHYYKFSYTGTMAVVKVSDTTYAVALTVTRNATATATPTKG